MDSPDRPDGTGALVGKAARACCSTNLVHMAAADADLDHKDAARARTTGDAGAHNVLVRSGPREEELCGSGWRSRDYGTILRTMQERAVSAHASPSAQSQRQQGPSVGDTMKIGGE